jgi:hypothetical protein
MIHLRNLPAIFFERELRHYSQYITRPVSLLAATCAVSVLLMPLSPLTLSSPVAGEGK